MPQPAAVTLHPEIGVTADKNGRPRFHVLSGMRSFPLPRAAAIASIDAGARVYVGSMRDAICDRGHYATPVELEEFLG